jgi:hypothetical protein
MASLKRTRGPSLLSTASADLSISQGRFILITLCNADLCAHGFVDWQPMADLQATKDLKFLEEFYRNSLWLRSDASEPLIGNQDCPHLAQTYGLLRRSCLTVFLDAQNERNVTCRFERCFAFTFSTVDNALKHLREHHFGNRPFVCLSTDGVAW